AVLAATIAILQATRLALHLGSGRFKNEEPGASRTCHFAGCPSPSLSQTDRAFQDCQRRATATAWYLTAFSECADQMDGCLIGLDCGRNPAGANKTFLLFAPQTASGSCRRRFARHRSFGALLCGGSFYRRNRSVYGT